MPKLKCKGRYNCEKSRDRRLHESEMKSKGVKEKPRKNGNRLSKKIIGLFLLNKKWERVRVFYW